jgi:hypothetical protein
LEEEEGIEPDCPSFIGELLAAEFARMTLAKSLLPARRAVVTAFGRRFATSGKFVVSRRGPSLGRPTLQMDRNPGLPPGGSVYPLTCKILSGP